ncbi:MAG: GtrA family protein [Desulfuromonadales bacterium]|nr:GtrA family protein [Desulfuromonadales bacterium]
MELDQKTIIFRQFLVFSAVGAVGTTSHFVVLFLLVQFAGTPPVPASVAGFVVGAVVNYWLNYLITFRSHKPHGPTFTKFLVVALVGLGLNTLIMAIGTMWLYYLFSQALATGLVLVWNFLCNRFWTFKEIAP